MSSQSQITDEWTPSRKPQYDVADRRECQHCGNFVSADWARVSGDNDNVVHRCPECATNRELKDGAAAGLDTERRGLGLGGGRK